MKKTTRLKFFAGIILVIALCAGLFVYLDYSMSRVKAIDGQLESDNYTVGIDYSGIITEEFVNEGAYVKVGDPLLKMRSPTLAEAIRDNEVAKTSLLYSVDAEGIVLISAAAPGRVQSIAYREGGFVPANSQIAVINNEDGLYASATFVLSSPDYTRLNTNSKVYVTLPDGKKVEGIVYDILLDKKDDEVQTTVRARFDNNAINTTTFTVGTPIDAVLELSTDTLFERGVSAVTSLFSPAGK
jgi:multidrug resistance efflux pump